MQLRKLDLVKSGVGFDKLESHLVHQMTMNTENREKGSSLLGRQEYIMSEQTRPEDLKLETGVILDPIAAAGPSK